MIEGFVERLRFAKKNESVNSFAKRAGISESVLRSYFEGSMPGIDKALLISKASGVSLLWLVTGEGTPEGGSGELTTPQGYYPEKTIINVTTALYEYLEKDKSRLNPFVFGETVALLCRLKPDGNIDSALIKSLMDFKSR